MNAPGEDSGGGFRVGDRVDLKAVSQQIAGDDISDSGIIVDHQHSSYLPRPLKGAWSVINALGRMSHRWEITWPGWVEDAKVLTRSSPVHRTFSDRRARRRATLRPSEAWLLRLRCRGRPEVCRVRNQPRAVTTDVHDSTMATAHPCGGSQPGSIARKVLATRRQLSGGRIRDPARAIRATSSQAGRPGRGSSKDGGQRHVRARASPHLESTSPSRRQWQDDTQPNPLHQRDRVSQLCVPTSVAGSCTVRIFAYHSIVTIETRRVVPSGSAPQRDARPPSSR